MKNLPQIVGMVAVNDKGQVVIPVETRNDLHITSGDKLMVIRHPSQESFMLIKPDRLEYFAKQMAEQVRDMNSLIQQTEEDQR